MSCLLLLTTDMSSWALRFLLRRCSSGFQSQTLVFVLYSVFCCFLTMLVAWLYGRICPLVSRFVPPPLKSRLKYFKNYWMYCRVLGTDIQGLLGMNLNILADPLTLPVVSPAASQFWFWMKCLDICRTDCHTSWYGHLCPPQDKL